MDRNCHLRQ